ncbi:MAG: sulfotransferase [Chloroflexi bacterium]|nr:sulfotransferase [Chloroflexota bacterium]
MDAETARALPNLVVIGAMKCGTSSFHEYLDAHPAVAMSRPKELDFFLGPPRGSWAQGVAWYAGHFDAGSPIRGEASPNYSKWPMYDGVPERMHALLPDAKLIYLVRDPIERIVSHYLHAVSAGRERRSIDAALADLQDNWYVTCTRYAMQVGRFLEGYPRDRVLILAAEELRGDTGGVMADTFRFLGVDPSFTSPRFTKVRNPTSVRGEPTRVGRLLGPLLPRRYASGLRALPLLGRSLFTPVRKPVVSASVRARLQEALTEDVAALRALTRPDFGPWSF